MPGRVSGAVLSGEIDRYCLRLGITKAALARASGVPAQTLSHVLRVKAVRAETVAAVRGFIKANPDQLPDDLPPPRDRVVAPLPVRALSAPVAVRATPAEIVVSAMVETPSDLVRYVTARWPTVWQAVLVRARADERAPGAALLAAIERGLGMEATRG